MDNKQEKQLQTEIKGDEKRWYKKSRVLTSS